MSRRSCLPIVVYVVVSFLVSRSSSVFAQSDGYGPDFPTTPVGSTLEHNGWELTCRDTADKTNVVTDTRTEQITINGVHVMTIKVDTTYAGGPTASVLWVLSGEYSLVVGQGGHSNFGGVGVTPSEYQWSLGATVDFWEERFWTANYAVKHEEQTPYGTQINYYGVDGLSNIGVFGRGRRFEISDEPVYWWRYLLHTVH